MKTVTVCWLALPGLLLAAPPEPAPGPKTDPPPPVVVAPPARPAPAEPAPDGQRNWAAARGPLVTPEQAQAVIEKFKAAYGKLGNPRFLIYVNRDLVDEASGLKLSARTEKSVSSRTNDAKGALESVRVENENRYRLRERTSPTLADRQTVREIEQLFGRPFRSAGVVLADQRTASQLIGDKSLNSFAVQTESESARKDREAISKIAEVAIEILIGSQNVTVPELSGDRTYSVADIQATAIRLNDARILAQASSADIIGKQPSPQVVRSAGTREVAEATALALMEDLLLSVQ